MKTLLSFSMVSSLSITVGISPAFAMDHLCVTREKNAASYQFAQHMGVPVQNVKVLAFQFGAWPEIDVNRTGPTVDVDQVTVRAAHPVSRRTVTQKFDVVVRPIEGTGDCRILRVIRSRR